MSKAALIKKYEDMMYKYDEFDAWEDDIKPKLNKMTAEEIKKIYEDDKQFYEARKAAGGCW